MSSLARLRRVLWILVAVTAPLALVVVFGFGLTRDPSRIPSATVGAKAPAFELQELQGGDPVGLAAYRGKVLVVNFWASWCVSCLVEHETLVALGQIAQSRQDLAVVGVNYRDTRFAASEFLRKHGEYPYPSGIDAQGRTGIDFGVYGLPETYFIDADGRIAERHIGPLEMEAALRILERMGVLL